MPLAVETTTLVVRCDAMLRVAWTQMICPSVGLGAPMPPKMVTALPVADAVRTVAPAALPSMKGVPMLLAVAPTTVKVMLSPKLIVAPPSKRTAKTTSTSVPALNVSGRTE
jgi:hypothetical protein